MNWSKLLQITLALGTAIVLVIATRFVIQNASENLTDKPALPQFPLPFRSNKLDQGCEGKDLPFSFFRHPLFPEESDIHNPGVTSCIEFIRWVGLGCPEKVEFQEEIEPKIYDDLEIFPAFGPGPLMTCHAALFEKKGFKAVEKGGKQKLRGYATILSRYYLFEKGNAKVSLSWARKGAESGEAGCMYLLGIAYRMGNGVVRDDVEGLMWLTLACSLGDLNAQGELLALSDEERKSLIKQMDKAEQRAREWQKAHENLFFIDP